jgi:hypothetical protein
MSGSQAGKLIYGLDTVIHLQRIAPRPPIGGERTRPQTPFAGGHILLMDELSGSRGLDLG